MTRPVAYGLLFVGTQVQLVAKSYSSYGEKRVKRGKRNRFGELVHKGRPEIRQWTTIGKARRYAEKQNATAERRKDVNPVEVVTLHLTDRELDAVASENGPELLAAAKAVLNDLHLGGLAVVQRLEEVIQKAEFNDGLH